MSIFSPLIRIVGVSLYASSALAQTDAVLPEVVVTASRTAQTVDESLAAVTVITREQIEQSQALSVTELLKTVAGVQVVRNGGLGQTSSIFMRGAESDQVLVLIDGIKVGSASAGTTAFQYLPLSQIERIEVVRGPRASLYGSEAIGGVIQLFTRRGEAGQLTASVGAGSDQTLQATASYAGSHGDTFYNVSAEHLSSDGYDACDDSNGGVGGCFTVEPDDDGYDNNAVSMRLGHHFQQGTVEAYALRAEGSADYDSSFNNQVDFVQQVLGVQGNWQVNENWITQLRLGEARDDSDNYGTDYPSQYETTRRSASWQNDWFISEQHMVSIGYDFMHDELDTNSGFAVTERDNHGIFAQYQGQFGAADVQLGVRHDDNEQFGTHQTGQIALGYALNAQTRMFASWGTAFKAPSFNELYFPNFGNPNLNPEESDSWELGFNGRTGAVHWTLNGFYNTAEELIATAYDAASDSYLPVNVAEAEIYGAEASLAWTMGAWSLDSQFTALHAEDKSTGNDLARRAPYTWRLNVARQWQQWRFASELLAQSHRYDDTSNLNRLAGYATVDLLSEYAVNPHWTMKARISNIFGTDYEESRFYVAPDRAFFISLHYQSQ